MNGRSAFAVTLRACGPAWPLAHGVADDDKGFIETSHGAGTPSGSRQVVRQFKEISKYL